MQPQAATQVAARRAQVPRLNLTAALAQTAHQQSARRPDPHAKPAQKQLPQQHGGGHQDVQMLRPQAMQQQPGMIVGPEVDAGASLRIQQSQQDEQAHQKQPRLTAELLSSLRPVLRVSADMSPMSHKLPCSRSVVDAGGKHACMVPGHMLTPHEARNNSTSGCAKKAAVATCDCWCCCKQHWREDPSSPCCISIANPSLCLSPVLSTDCTIVIIAVSPIRI